MSESPSIESQLDAIRDSIQHLQTSISEVRALVGPFGAAFPDGAMLVQTIYGTKYFIDPSDDIMAPQLVVYRQWEADLSNFMLNSVDKDSVFVDIGANFGYFTCLVGSRIGNTGNGRVISVEPNPKMFSLLQRNIGINWSMSPIETHCCAAADSIGYMQFSVPEGRAANAGLSSRSSEAPAPGEQRFIVPTKTLEQIVNNRSIDLMKIDVEGFEMLVLRGLGSVLKTSSNLAIVMEWSPAQMLSAGFSVPEFVDLLGQFCLSAFHIPNTRYIDTEQINRLTIRPDQLATLAYDNILLRRNLS